MEQKELYELAGKLTDEEVAYLVSSHLEHIKKCEFGFSIDAGDMVFKGHVECVPKERHIFGSTPTPRFKW